MQKPPVHGDLNARQYAFNPRRRSVRIDKGAGTERGRVARSAPFFFPVKNSFRFIVERVYLTLIHLASSFPCLFEREKEREKLEIMLHNVRNFAPLEALNEKV